MVGFDIFFNFTSLNYKLKEKKVVFSQLLIDEGTITHINTEKADVEMLSLFSDNDGFVMEFEQDSILYWIYDGYLIEIAGNVNKNELIDLAHSTKIINLPKKF